MKQAPIMSLAVASATFAVAGIAIAWRTVEDQALALLHVGSSVVPGVDVGPGFNPAGAAVAAFVLFFTGVVSGLSGFAFSAVAACILWLLPPLQALPLIMLLSTCNQLLSVGALRKELVLRSTAEREGALPYIAGGLVGVPIGLAILQALPTPIFSGGLGLFLIITVRLFSSNPTACGSGCRAGSRPWRWAPPVASSAGFPLSPGQYL
jgi:uncharacterized membrane protein YfcA